MLKQLRINNIILIENADIAFEQGLNVLSGETGSGKSAIMEALSLVLGDRAESTLIRRNCDKGTVEARFDIEKIPHLITLLDEAGIEHDKQEDLIVRREIHSNGKSRAFVNNQMAQLTLLRGIGDSLIDILGQHANQRLRVVENHRTMLDLFGDLKDLQVTFKKAWEKENVLKKALEELINNESKRLREIEVFRMEIEELQEAQLKEGEDEVLFNEYTLLTHSEELNQHIEEITQTLSGEKQAVLTQLNRLKLAFDALTAIDPSYEETSKALTASLLELQEVAYTMRSARGRVEFNPQRITEVNQRLGLINRLKKKYGTTIEEVAQYQSTIEKKLEDLENADVKIEELTAALAAAEKESHRLAQELTAKRKAVAKTLEKAIVIQLRALNMPKVEFQVQITDQKRNAYGDNKVEFFLAPNVGEHSVSIKECASGGELSRLMLALQTVLAGKENTPTLVFDEIDANIGGETATVMGEKLSEIGHKHQVLCITHFPQVARQAKHHLQISKKEIEGRTVTCIIVLDKAAREIEIKRMLG